MTRDYQNLFNKLQLLKEKDKKFSVYGSKSHKYQLAPPLKEEQILAFEEKYKITLPGEYREFLKQVGASGAGPGNGLYTFDEFMTDEEMLMYLPKPFLYIKNYEEVMRLHKENLGLDVGVDDPSASIYEPAPGILIIADEGCAWDIGLVLNGPERGNIWCYRDPGWVPAYPKGASILDENGQPFAMNFSTFDSKIWHEYYTHLLAERNQHLRLSFYEWYEQWLDVNFS